MSDEREASWLSEGFYSPFRCAEHKVVPVGMMVYVGASDRRKSDRPKDLDVGSHRFSCNRDLRGDLSILVQALRTKVFGRVDGRDHPGDDAR